jgi:polar amino acid transport system substrate-binding protein
MRAWRMAAVCMVSGMLCSHAGAADKTISLYFNERPPYIVASNDGSVAGLIATSAAKAFNAARVPFVWVRMPTSRQFLNIQRNMEPACMVGVYKLAEREQYAKFTKPVYPSRQTVALVHRSVEMAQGVKLDDVLARKGLRVLVKDMYSYGSQVDALMLRRKPEIVHTTNENVSMAKMVGMKQADLMFMSDEEAQVVVEKIGAAGLELRIVRFQDVQRAPERHIMCSKLVPDEVIMRLNQVIN